MDASAIHVNQQKFKTIYTKGKGGCERELIGRVQDKINHGSSLGGDNNSRSALGRFEDKRTK
jgi:hypothetical protein